MISHITSACDGAWQDLIQASNDALNVFQYPTIFPADPFAMWSSFIPLIYCVVVIALLWQAFFVIRRGFLFERGQKLERLELQGNRSDRTGRLTIHPELLDQEGRITEEELLTVRFSGDIDPPHSAETSAE